MKTKSHESKITTKIANHRKRPLKTTACGLMVTGSLFFGHWVSAQSLPQPGLTIASGSSNQIVITITNPVAANYEVWKTPVLGDTVDYPWIIAAVGTNGQSSYAVPRDIYPSEFYQVILDTNSVPLWEAAVPTNPSIGLLSIFISSPTNGALLQ